MTNLQPNTQTYKIPREYRTQLDFARGMEERIPFEILSYRDLNKGFVYEFGVQDGKVAMFVGIDGERRISLSGREDLRDSLAEAIQREMKILLVEHKPTSKDKRKRTLH